MSSAECVTELEMMSEECLTVSVRPNRLNQHIVTLVPHALTQTPDTDERRLKAASLNKKVGPGTKCTEWARCSCDAASKQVRTITVHRRGSALNEEHWCKYEESMKKKEKKDRSGRYAQALMSCFTSMGMSTASRDKWNQLIRQLEMESRPRRHLER